MKKICLLLGIATLLVCANSAVWADTISVSFSEPPDESTENAEVIGNYVYNISKGHEFCSASLTSKFTTSTYLAVQTASSWNLTRS